MLLRFDTASANSSHCLSWKIASLDDWYTSVSCRSLEWQFFGLNRHSRMPIQSSLIYRHRAVKLTDQTELIRLCKVNKLLGMERETLKKAAVFFVNEVDQSTSLFENKDVICSCFRPPWNSNFYPFTDKKWKLSGSQLSLFCLPQLRWYSIKGNVLFWSPHPNLFHEGEGAFLTLNNCLRASSEIPWCLD